MCVGACRRGGESACSVPRGLLSSLDCGPAHHRPAATATAIPCISLFTETCVLCCAGAICRRNATSKGRQQTPQKLRSSSRITTACMCLSQWRCAIPDTCGLHCGPPWLCICRIEAPGWHTHPCPLPPFLALPPPYAVTGTGSPTKPAEKPHPTHGQSTLGRHKGGEAMRPMGCRGPALAGRGGEWLLQYPSARPGSAKAVGHRQQGCMTHTLISHGLRHCLRPGAHHSVAGAALWAAPGAPPLHIHHLVRLGGDRDLCRRGGGGEAQAKKSLCA